MNTQLSISPFEIKYSRTGSPVPVVKGVHLHSIYDPEREAENFIESQIKNIKGKNEILILGLGFGYHVTALKNYYKSIGQECGIKVIESNINVYNYIKANNIVDLKEIEVICSDRVSDLYSTESLVNFLLNKPAIVAHPASFNHYQQFFKDFLTYAAPTSIGKMLDSVENKHVKNYLGEIDPRMSLTDYFSVVSLKPEQHEMDLLTMALSEIVNSNKSQNI